jgi:asparagine synthase (glutamine-hydrolysing)
LCGICGVVGISDKELIKKMCDVIQHRGPDDHGYFIDDKVCLGNRRLSIIDIAGGHQPIHNEDESIWITYNGEIYNFLELKNELERKGHRFYTNSDTETIIHCYEEYGDECPKKLRGMFGFAIWDKKRKMLLLARDRLGKKPLYYTVIDGNFIFASEIKSILQYEGVKREVNPRALHHFLTLQYVPGPDTMFKGIFKLPQGCILTYQNGRIKISKYWDINMKISEEGNEEYYSKKILDLFKESVKIRLMSEVPLGVYLSGGIDSSAVTGVMSTLIDEPVKTFTVGFGHPTDEFKYAKIVADRFDTDHKELTVKAKSVEILPKVIWHFDEPVADPAALPTFLMSQATKKYVTVVLVGEGGDEVFAGYPKYKIMRNLKHYKKRIPKVLRGKFSSKSLTFLAKILPDSKTKKYIDFAAGFIPSWENDSESYLKMCSPGFNEEEKMELYSREFKEKMKNENTVNVLKPYFKRNIDFVNKMVAFDMKVWMCDRLLMKVDKMTMAYSIEARAPFLDQVLVNFANRMPMNLRIGKYIFKKAMKDILPKEILERRKHAFVVPISTWFDKELKDLASEILMKLHRGEYFKKKYIDGHILRNTKKLMHDHQIWNLLNFEIWYKIFIEGHNLAKPQLSLDKLIE